MTLMEFLKARLAEDAEVAHATRKFEQRVPHTERWFASHGDAITSMAPHRAVAEVDAKRRIVDEYEQATGQYATHSQVSAGEEIGLRFALKALALPYADHPDYDPAWRP